jgi:hypothetical protein
VVAAEAGGPGAVDQAAQEARLGAGGVVVVDFDESAAGTAAEEGAHQASGEPVVGQALHPVHVVSPFVRGGAERPGAPAGHE